MIVNDKTNFILQRELHWKGLSEEERKRQEAILEFIMTESNYCNRLSTISKVFMEGLRSITDPKDFSKLFNNIDELLFHSALLLDDLTCLQASHSGLISSIVGIFLRHLEQFDCFKTYCVGHEESTKILQKIEGVEIFRRFLTNVMDDPQCCGLDLASFLLEPVQRLARYPLLLKQILHYTPKSHPDHQPLLESIQKCEQFVQKVNSFVREHHNQLALSELQNSIIIPMDGDFALVQFLSENQYYFGSISWLEKLEKALSELF